MTGSGRVALIAGLLGLAPALEPAAAGGGEAPAPLLSIAGAPGSLAITNPAATPLVIARPIAVERLAGGQWIDVRTGFDAVAVCPARSEDLSRTVTLPPHRTLTVRPWHAYSCSSQCAVSCRANIWLGSGPFRFVVTALPAGRRVATPSFSVPSRDAG